MALIALFLLVAFVFMGAGILAFVLAIIRSLWLGTEAIMNGVPRGVWLFLRIVAKVLRLTTWAVVRLVRVSRWLHSVACVGGLWLAWAGYSAALSVTYCLREWYAESEARKRVKS